MITKHKLYHANRFNRSIKMSTGNIVLDLLGAQLVDVNTLVPAEITSVHACIPSACI